MKDIIKIECIYLWNEGNPTVFQKISLMFLKSVFILKDKVSI